MKIGILSGIGIEAGHYVYGEVIKRIQQSGSIRSNTDYPQIIINSINAPELHLEEHDCSDVLSHYIKGVRELAVYQPDFIAMACNTIHLFRNDIIRATGFSRILSVREIVEKELCVQGVKNICVLGTGLTLTRGLYHYEGMIQERLSYKEQEKLMDVIYKFNTGEITREEGQGMLFPLLNGKQEHGVESFLLACTEISEVLHDSNIPAIDALELLIDEIVNRFVTRNTLEVAA